MGFEISRADTRRPGNLVLRQSTNKKAACKFALPRRGAPCNGEYFGTSYTAIHGAGTRDGRPNPAVAADGPMKSWSFLFHTTHALVSGAYKYDAECALLAGICDEERVSRASLLVPPRRRAGLCNTSETSPTRVDWLVAFPLVGRCSAKSEHVGGGTGAGHGRTEGFFLDYACLLFFGCIPV